MKGEAGYGDIESALSWVHGAQGDSLDDVYMRNDLKECKKTRSSLTILYLVSE